jgi:hypothetical protein
MKKHPLTGICTLHCNRLERSGPEQTEIINDIETAQDHGSWKVLDEAGFSIIVESVDMKAAVKTARTPHGTGIYTQRIKWRFHPSVSEISEKIL